MKKKSHHEKKKLFFLTTFGHASSPMNACSKRSVCDEILPRLARVYLLRRFCLLGFWIVLFWSPQTSPSHRGWRFPFVGFGLAFFFGQAWAKQQKTRGRTRTSDFSWVIFFPFLTIPVPAIDISGDGHPPHPPVSGGLSPHGAQFMIGSSEERATDSDCCNSCAGSKNSKMATDGGNHFSFRCIPLSPHHTLFATFLCGFLFLCSNNFLRLRPLFSPSSCFNFVFLACVGACSWSYLQVALCDVPGPAHVNFLMIGLACTDFSWKTIRVSDFLQDPAIKLIFKTIVH